MILPDVIVQFYSHLWGGGTLANHRADHLLHSDNQILTHWSTWEQMYMKEKSPPVHSESWQDLIYFHAFFFTKYFITAQISISSIFKNEYTGRTIEICLHTTALLLHIFINKGLVIMVELISTSNDHYR